MNTHVCVFLVCFVELTVVCVDDYIIKQHTEQHTAADPPETVGTPQEECSTKKQKIPALKFM